MRAQNEFERALLKFENQLGALSIACENLEVGGISCGKPRKYFRGRPGRVNRSCKLSAHNRELNSYYKVTQHFL